MKESYIFGAKATAAGLYKALSLLEPEKNTAAFLVSDTAENVPEIWGVPVKAIFDVAGTLSEIEKNNALVYAAVPELVHTEIRELLEGYGFSNLSMLDSRLEADLMGQYFDTIGRFRSVHSLGFDEIANITKLTIYAASFYKDKPLNNPPKHPQYIKILYLGCDGAEKAGIVTIKQTFMITQVLRDELNTVATTFLFQEPDWAKRHGIVGTTRKKRRWRHAVIAFSVCRI